MFYFVWFRLSCLPLLVLILILCRYYILWHPSKTESMHAGDQSLSACMVIGSDDERDPKYVPPGHFYTFTCSQSRTKKVVSGVVTASQSDEERTLTGTTSRSAANEEGAFGSFGVSWSEEASGFAEVPAPTTSAASA